MPFKFIKLDIPEVLLIEPTIFGDERGFFVETYKQSEFVSNGIDHHFVQDNHSKSNKSILRGLHYQLNPNAQGKLIRVVQGAVFDVAVDLRQGAPTFGRWVSVELNDRQKNMLWIPPGFAHGFCVLEDNTHVLYKTTAEYHPGDERGIFWNDPALGIKWPISNPLLSERDQRWPGIKDAEMNFSFSHSPNSK
jgi:dTDP-4-dehydrorhamnose 3,5-epimerase